MPGHGFALAASMTSPAPPGRKLRIKGNRIIASNHDHVGTFAICRQSWMASTLSIFVGHNSAG